MHKHPNVKMWRALRVDAKVFKSPGGVLCKTDLRNRRIVVGLSSSEMREVVDLGQRRSRKGKFLKSSRNWSGHSHVTNNIIGMAGEYVVAKFLGVEPDRRIFSNHGDDGSDGSSPQYGVYQVKAVHATKYGDMPWLRVPHNDKSLVKCHTFWLVTVDERTLKSTIHGWCYRHELVLSKPFPCKAGGPLNHVLREWELHSPHEEADSVILFRDSV